MSRESYQARRVSYQKTKTGKAPHDNAKLATQLQHAHAEVAALKLEIAKLENGLAQLNAKLQDAAHQVGILSLSTKRQESDTPQEF